MQFTTTKNDFWITRLRSVINSEKIADPDIRIGIFGSSTKSSIISDIDLVLIYRSHVSQDQLNGLKLRLRAAIHTFFRLPVDFVTLSEQEAMESSFLQDEGVVLVLDWRLQT